MKNSRQRGENSSGFTNEQSPQGRAFSVDLLDQKSKSPLFPRAGGPWLQMTSALVEYSGLLVSMCEVRNVIPNGA